MKRKILTQLWSHRLLLPLLLLTGLSISALITVVRGTVVLSDVTYGLSLTGKHYAAFGAILLNFLIYFRFRKLYGYSLAITILAGIFSLLVFPYKDSVIGIEGNWLSMMIQPSALIAGVLAGLLRDRKSTRLNSSH